MLASASRRIHSGGDNGLQNQVLRSGVVHGLEAHATQDTRLQRRGRPGFSPEFPVLSVASFAADHQRTL